jgi:hypothetical protein
MTSNAATPSTVRPIAGAFNAWMNEVIDHLGDASTNIDLVGTLLHREALPAQLRERSDVRFRLFKSIEAEARDEGGSGTPGSKSWPTRKTPGALKTAREFFEARRERMLEGSRVLWPERESYYDLQLMRHLPGRGCLPEGKAERAAAFGPRRLRSGHVSGDSS